MPLPLVASLILASALHAGPERAVTPPVPESQPYSQVVHKAVSGTDSALVVWSDHDHQLPQVRAARVDGDGRTLDSRPLIVAASDLDAWTNADAARGSDRWLVVWTSRTSIFARTVLDDGTMGTPVILASSANVGNFRVASDGSGFLAVWERSTYSTSFSVSVALEVARLDATGTVVDAAHEVARSDATFSVGPFLASNTGYVLLLNTYDGHIDRVALTPSGEIVERRRIATERDAFVTTATFDKDVLVFGWTLWDGVRVLREGEAARTIAPPGATLQQLFVFGGRVHVMLTVDGDVTLRPLDEEAGRTWDVAYETGSARATALGDRLLVSASAGWSENLDVYTTVVDTSLQDVTPAQLIYAEPQLQTKPAVARNAGGALVAWSEWYRAEPRRVILAALVDARGVATSTPFVVGEAEPVWRNVQVASDGEDFLVTWTGPGETAFARRVLHDGTMPAEAVAIGQTNDSACVAWNGAAYVIGYAHVISSTRWTLTAEARVRMLRPDGTMSEPIVVSPPEHVMQVACASGDASSLITWTRLGEVRGALVTHGGSVTSPFRIGNGNAAVVASNGENFLAAWFTREGNVDRARITPAGSVEVPFVPSIPGGAIEYTLADGVAISAKDDGSYLLAWGTRDVFALPLASNGDVTGPPFDVNPEGVTDRFPALAGDLLVYEREAQVPAADRWRIFARTLSDAPRRRRATR